MNNGLESKLGRTMDQENDEQIEKIYNRIVGNLITDVISGSVASDRTVTLSEYIRPNDYESTKQAVQLVKDYFDNEGFMTKVEIFSDRHLDNDQVHGFLIEVRLWSY